MFNIIHNLLREPELGAPPSGGGSPPANDTPWHSLAVIGEGESAKLNDPAQWLDKAPAPLSKFIKDQMTAARAKTDGMVRVPGQDAKPEDIAAFQRALGVPDKPDGYGLVKPEKLPDGVAWDDQHIAKFTETAHKLGLTPAQVKGLAEFQTAYVGEAAAMTRAEIEKGIALEKETLSKRFGENIGQAVSAANALANVKGIPDTMKAVISKGAFDPQSPEFWGADSLEFAAFVAKALGEDRVVGSSKVVSGSNTVEHWKAVMSEGSKAPEGSVLRRDFDLLSRQDPETVNRYNEAYKQAIA